MRQNDRISTNALDDLLCKDPTAKEYFMALGEDAQGMLRQRSDQIHTLKDMHSAAQSVRFDG